MGVLPVVVVVVMVVSPLGLLRGTIVILGEWLLECEQKRQGRTRLEYIQAAKQGPEMDRGKEEGEKRKGIREGGKPNGQKSLTRWGELLQLSQWLNTQYEVMINIFAYK